MDSLCEIRQLLLYFIYLLNLYNTLENITKIHIIKSEFQIVIVNYQQPGEAKNPYLEQYSAVLEDSPVIIS
jgi:hypothetical protein